mmetsp:Transcript_129893/g.238888  ORF Transcript_129893/g.238888 Transcript_129893/m.238888 type:complete len:103 (-) Transcript_129893:519-827(-)
MCYYATLGVDPLAGAPEIRAAYMRRALETHPDKPGGTKKEFQKLVEAFEVLADAARRRQYDTTRAKAWPAAARVRAPCRDVNATAQPYCVSSGKSRSCPLAA